MTGDPPPKSMPAGHRSIDDAQCMKPPVRGKYLVTEHAVELRRIIPALPIVAAVTGFLRTGDSETAGADASCGCIVTVREVSRGEVRGNRP